MRYKSLPLYVRSGGPGRRPAGQRVPGKRPEPPSRLRDWVATSPVLLIVVCMIIGQVVQAAGPDLHVDGIASPGATVAVHGQGFPQPLVQLWWDGSIRGLPATDVAADGSFTYDLLIPNNAAVGTHTVAATLPGASPGQVRRGAGILASVSVEVASATPSSAPPTSTPDATPVPTHDHQATPTPSPSSSNQPTPSPSASPTPVPDGPNPLTCTGYPERRIFLEVQSWWDGTNTNGMAHVHAGTCFPLGQTVHGVVRLDTRITMHDNPGHLFALSTDLFTNGLGTGDNNYIKLDRYCSGTCQFWVTSYVDTRGALDGWHEIRIKARVRFADERRQMTSTGWVVRTENGNAYGSSRDATGAVIGRGWYEGDGYQNPDIRSMSSVLGGPVSGTWTVNVRLGPGGQGFAPTFTAAYVDPDFHMGSEGWRVLSRLTTYLGPLAIDTTRLANGPHRLVLRVESEHNGEMLDGILVLPFTVRN